MGVVAASLRVLPCSSQSGSGGHLYIGKVGPGIGLLCLHFFLLLLLFTLVWSDLRNPRLDGVVRLRCLQRTQRRS